MTGPRPGETPRGDLEQLHEVVERKPLPWIAGELAEHAAQGVLSEPLLLALLAALSERDEAEIRQTLLAAGSPPALAAAAAAAIAERQPAAKVAATTTPRPSETKEALAQLREVAARKPLDWIAGHLAGHYATQGCQREAQLLVPLAALTAEDEAEIRETLEALGSQANLLAIAAAIANEQQPPDRAARANVYATDARRLAHVAASVAWYLVVLELRDFYREAGRAADLAAVEAVLTAYEQGSEHVESTHLTRAELVDALVEQAPGGPERADVWRQALLQLPDEQLVRLYREVRPLA